MVSCGKNAVGNHNKVIDLEIPVIRQDCNSVEWDPIPDAVSYTVNIDGQETVILRNSVNIGELAGIGEFNVKVRANGNGISVENSPWSEPIIVKIQRYSVPLTTPSVQSTLTGHPRLFLLQDEEMLISKLLANRGNSWLINAHTYILSLSYQSYAN